MSIDASALGKLPEIHFDKKSLMQLYDTDETLYYIFTVSSLLPLYSHIKSGFILLLLLSVNVLFRPLSSNFNNEYYIMNRSQFPSNFYPTENPNEIDFYHYITNWAHSLYV
ncbi:hypothetical protein BCR42DRAFT_224282 [Absidia repens]|uniref:Uncharacterized protein n=1 Tax=Absidia repens TaxID=90262 RepID=A0A1X2IP67_9FUNG|nr:hypothetical protein BCR42DRAFT_224282 [Absidia repens]